MNVLGYMKRYGIHRCFREKEGEWDVFVSRSCGCNETQGSRHRTHERGSEAASVCAELRCGGGQIVKTGAPQRLSLSKGKLYSIPHPLLYSSYSVEMQTSPLSSICVCRCLAVTFAANTHAEDLSHLEGKLFKVDNFRPTRGMYMWSSPSTKGF